MKALYKKEAKPGIWMTHDAPVPAIGANDVLIKIKKTSVCGTDIHIYKWDAWSQRNVPLGLITGHEYVAWSTRLAARLLALSLGTGFRARASYVRNLPQLPQRAQAFVHSAEGHCVNQPGAFAEYLCLPAANAIKIPDGVSDDFAAIFDPFGNAVHTALSFNLVGEDVLITGAGPIGIMACAVCAFAGARHIVITDVNDYRLDLAKKMGATCTVNVAKQSLATVMSELKMGEGFDVGWRCPATGCIPLHDRSDAAGRKNRHAGILPPIWASIGARLFSRPDHQGIYGREMFETWYKMIVMVQSGLDLSPLITHHFPIDEYQTAFETMASGQSGKVILEWS